MISELNILSQSAFFAKLSNYVYNDLAFMRTTYDQYAVKYYSHEGSDVYTLEDDNDFIIACRGTEVKQLSDIQADLSISKTQADHGKLHIGFNHYVDKVWADIAMNVLNAKNKKIWVTGHSLGAAMATIMAYRFATYEGCSTPEALFTYGSPRVGDRTFINYFNTLPFAHHRWVNDGDIITKIPLTPFFYHCGIMHHIDASGVPTLNYERTFNPMRLLGLTSPKGILNMVMGDAKDHSSDKYRIFLTAAVS